MQTEQDRPVQTGDESQSAQESEQAWASTLARAIMAAPPPAPQLEAILAVEPLAAPLSEPAGAEDREQP